MNSLEDLRYTTSTTKKYWCHICKKEFSKLYIEGVEVQCRMCNSPFCEEISETSNEDHPSNFRPYDSNTNQQTRPRRSNFLEIVFPRQINRLNVVGNNGSNILDFVNSILNYNEDTHLENIINYLMANDPNQYGNPPASKKSIESLESIVVDELSYTELKTNGLIECSVCKDEFILKESIKKMPCKHFFHEACLGPWLEQRNSCPTCRYELPTDDAEYEKRKNEKRNYVRNNINNI
jgi:E3 ubiquitin-protein ligase RNF115/126